MIAGAGRETADVVKTAPLQSSGLVWKIAAGVLATAVALGVVAVLHFREQAPIRELVRFQIPGPEGAEATRPTLSPDGRQVAFVASRQLWVHSLESSASWPLPDTEGTGSHLIWSPDSRYLAFRLDGKLQKVEVAGGRPQPIADLPGNSLGGPWSREGVIVFGGNQGLMPRSSGTATGK